MANTTDPPRSVPLPAPTGPHRVGRLSTELVDDDRAEIYSTEATDRRELVLWVWYPAEPAGPTEPATYLPAPWLPVAQFIGLDVDGLRTHAMEGAPVARSTQGHPVLLLSPSGFSPLLLSALAEELASHGYVVVGVNPTYETTVTPFADGRVIPANPAALGGALGPQSGSHEEAFRQREQVCDYKAADLASVADHLELLRGAPGPLAGALDLGRLGALGHSFGGNAALEWCRVDPRCLAAVNLDGAVWTEVGRLGLDRPALQVLSEHGEFDVSPADAVAQGMAPDEAWFEAEKAITFGGWATVDERARPGRTATIAGARHLSFMDVPFLPAQENAAITAMLAAVTIAPERMWRVTSDLVLAFFAEHLDGIASALLDGDTSSHPEVRFGAP